jgi:hypothetical protein
VYWLGYGLADSRFQPCRYKIVLFPTKLSHQLCRVPSLLYIDDLGTFSWVKRPGLEVGYSLEASAEVHNEWSCLFAVAICFHGVDSVNVYL